MYALLKSTDILCLLSLSIFLSKLWIILCNLSDQNSITQHIIMGDNNIWQFLINSTKIIHTSNNKNRLKIIEAIYIRQKQPRCSKSDYNLQSNILGHIKKMHSTIIAMANLIMQEVPSATEGTSCIIRLVLLNLNIMLH